MDGESLAGHFEQYRPHLRAVAYRMLGSVADADDAVQDTWLRLSKSGAAGVENFGGYLTATVARVCLNMLRLRKSRREEPLDPSCVHIPDPVISQDGKLPPEDAALLGESVGLALLVVLDTLTPDERLAFVLHDMFDLPFKEIAAALGRSDASARQLASRARQRVKGDGDRPAPDPDRARQRKVVDAFFAATRKGDFDALVAVLHPRVVALSDGGSAWPATASQLSHGAEAVARQVLMARSVLPPDARVYPVVINGSAGAVVTVGGKASAVMGFTVADGKITELAAIIDPERTGRIAAPILVR
jgi:RNA polymerase sigma factor (sigma-70 family)